MKILSQVCVIIALLQICHASPPSLFWFKSVVGLIYDEVVDFTAAVTKTFPPNLDKSVTLMPIETKIIPELIYKFNMSIEKDFVSAVTGCYECLSADPQYDYDYVVGQLSNPSDYFLGYDPAEHLLVICTASDHKLPSNFMIYKTITSFGVLTCQTRLADMRRALTHFFMESWELGSAEISDNKSLSTPEN